MQLQFHGRPFSWPFLLAAVDFPIIGVDFLKQHSLMVDPANNSLVNAQGKSFPTLARASPPTASVVTGLHRQHSLSSPPSSSPPASSTSASSTSASSTSASSTSASSSPASSRPASSPSTSSPKEAACGSGCGECLKAPSCSEP
jgi:hypothetical protein